MVSVFIIIIKQISLSMLPSLHKKKCIVGFLYRFDKENSIAKELIRPLFFQIYCFKWIKVIIIAFGTISPL